MYIRSFEWDERNEEHISRHRVEPSEIEEAFAGEYHIFRSWEGRYTLLGRSAAGRYLFTAFKINSCIVRVITARDMSETERKRYGKKIK